MAQSCKIAYSRYKDFLEKKKNMEDMSNRAKRKRQLKDEMDENSRKKHRLNESKRILTDRADKLAMKAETCNDFQLLKQSNALRLEVKTLEKEMKSLHDENESLKESLNDL